MPVTLQTIRPKINRFLSRHPRLQRGINTFRGGLSPEQKKIVNKEKVALGQVFNTEISPNLSVKALTTANLVKQPANMLLAGLASQFTAAACIMGTVCTDSAGSLAVFAGLSLVPTFLFLKRVFFHNANGLFNADPFRSSTEIYIYPGMPEKDTRRIVSHELTHYLHHVGAIKDDRIANAVGMARNTMSFDGLDPTDRMSNDQTLAQIRKEGVRSILSAKDTEPRNELFEDAASYKFGSAIGSVARWLRCHYMDDQIMWDFIRQVGQGEKPTKAYELAVNDFSLRNPDLLPLNDA